jgi:hypothetical protein
MDDTSTHKTPGSNVSLFSRLKDTIFPESPGPSTAKPRPSGLRIPPYPAPQLSHPLASDPPSGYETVCTSCHAVNSRTFDNPYPQIPYVWHNNPGNHGRYPDIWCNSCRSKNSILQSQTQTAGRTEHGNEESIPTSNKEEDVEPEEQPPPAYVNIPHNSTDDWAENRKSPSSANTGPDGLLNTEGLGSTSSLFPFANQKGKGN